VNGSLYNFEVVAINSVGQGAPSSVVSSTPLTVPNPPIIGTATGGNTTATITWTAPVNNGGSPITGYTVTSNVGGFSATTTSTSATVTGLTNGNTYTFTVTATNAAGTSGVSGSTNPITLALFAPDAPNNVTSSIGNGQVTIMWQAPANNGGTPITGYLVTSTNGLSLLTTDTTVVIPGLNNGVSYSFSVAAINAIGTGAPAYISATPATVPDSPTNIVASAGNSTATINWTAPANNGGSAITSYTVSSNIGGFSATTTNTSVTITGLINGVAYAFTVIANNQIGSSLASSSSNIVKPSAPVVALPTLVPGIPAENSPSSPELLDPVYVDSITQINYVTVDGITVGGALFTGGDALQNQPLLIDQGKPITLVGQTVPFATVALTIHSDPYTVTVVADAAGMWSYTIYNLPVGSHYVEATITDTKTNKVLAYKNLISFTVVSKETTEARFFDSNFNKVVVISALLFGALVFKMFILDLNGRRKQSSIR
jgi:hypothetical protein